MIRSEENSTEFLRPSIIWLTQDSRVGYKQNSVFSASASASATSSSLVALVRGLEILASVPEVDIGLMDGVAQKTFIMFAIMQRLKEKMEKLFLLAMAPLHDGTNANALDHNKLMDLISEWYKRTRADIIFILGDNASINPAIAPNFRSHGYQEMENDG